MTAFAATDNKVPYEISMTDYPNSNLGTQTYRLKISTNYEGSLTEKYVNFAVTVFKNKALDTTNCEIAEFTKPATPNTVNYSLWSDPIAFDFT